MKVKYNNSMLHQVMSPLGDIGTITELGVNRCGIPVYYLQFKDKDIEDSWYPANKCNSKPGEKALLRFHFNYLFLRMPA